MAQNIAIERVDHIGVRVRNLDRALGFYRVLGFAVVRHAEGDDVAIIRNEHGVELNLVFNANAGDPATNILMDVRDKFPGYTHIALRVASISETVAALNENGIPIAQGPVIAGSMKSNTPMGHRLQLKLKLSAPIAAACELRHKFFRKTDSHVTCIGFLSSNPPSQRRVKRAPDSGFGHNAGVSRRGSFIGSFAGDRDSGGPCVLIPPPRLAGESEEHREITWERIAAE
jgi:lactoylglutathione lyase